MVSSGITKEELIGWGGTEVFNQALALVNSGDVREFRYDDETLTISGKIVQPNGYPMPVSFVLKPGGRIESHCPCPTNQRYSMVCPHVVALGLAVMVTEMEEAELEERQRTAAAPVPPPAVDYLEVPMKPRISAYLMGSRASLSLAIDVHYGEIDFPACSLQSPKTVYLPDPDDDGVRFVRSLPAEEAAMRLPAKWGFEPGYRKEDLKLYLTSPQGVLNFLGAGLPALRREGWRIELAPGLVELTDKMPSVVPVVAVRDAGRDFDIRISFDAMGAEISPIEVQAAVNRGEGYILKEGKVVLLDHTAIQVVAEVFKDCATSQGDAPSGWFRVKAIHAPFVKSSLESLDIIDLDDREARNWRESAARHNDRNPEARYEPVALGPLESILRPYQKQGVYWMRFLEESGYGGLLADEMGLGKTLQTLAWLSLPPANQAVHGPALIVCPTSLVRNWEAEAKKFTPWLKTLVISGPGRERDFIKIGAADLVITSYALLQRDFETAYLGRHFSTVVLDEAQHIKNRSTKNAKAVKLLEGDRHLVLTGTPIENSVADVWSIFDFLLPDYLGEYESFKLNYEDPIRDGVSEAVLLKLKRKLHPFILRRLKETVAKDLPAKIIKVSYCPMSEDAEREYSAALAATRQAAGGMVKAKGFAASKFEILAMLMKLRQLASRGKVEMFLEQLSTAIAGGHKILVFSQFVTMLKTLRERLDQAGVRYCYLDGSTADRLGECNRFNRSEEIPVFLISLMAGGTGLNLTGADMVMHYDPWWNPAVEDQATDRAHRIGQKKTVYVMKMIASGTIEEKVLELQRKKQAIIKATVATTDAAIMEKLTAADLSELLA